MIALSSMGVLWAANAQQATKAHQHSIDTAKSVMIVRVSKTGVFSALGHDHEIVAPISGGTVDATAHKVEVHVNAGELKVRDREVSDKDRAEIQTTMLGPEVLDARRYPEILFRSTSIQPSTDNSWKAEGSLTLHGQTHPVAVEVRETGRHYVGTSRLKQTDFGIKPVKAGGGTVSVKDELRIEFDIQLTR